MRIFLRRKVHLDSSSILWSDAKFGLIKVDGRDIGFGTKHHGMCQCAQPPSMRMQYCGDMSLAIQVSAQTSSKITIK
jgi:hypothetical protein